VLKNFEGRSGFMLQEFNTPRVRKFGWLASLAFFAICWFLPILDKNIGYDGAELAHKEFWRLLSEGRSIKTPREFFEFLFIAIGWLANEFYVIGMVTVFAWPKLAIRLFAFALGIMISWHIPFLEKFPLLIGYWFWVAAGGLALWLTALRVAEESGRSITRVLTEPVGAALFLFPVIVASTAVILGGLK
jgi:hypothetical protein